MTKGSVNKQLPTVIVFAHIVRKFIKLFYILADIYNWYPILCYVQ